MGTVNKYVLIEEGFQYGVVEAKSAESALAVAIDNVDRSNYDSDDCDGTLWIDVEVCRVCDHDEDTECDCADDREKSAVQLDPDEPECAGSEHMWESPEWLGGLKENPGVWGHGGGVLITKACTRCGCGKHINTWAQRPDTGEQGFESVRYEVGEFADKLEETSESESEEAKDDGAGAS